MTESISALEVRQKFGKILNRVALRNDCFVVERQGKEIAALVPVDFLRKMQEAADLQLLKLLGSKQPKLDDEQALALADMAKHAARRAKKVKKKKSVKV